MNRFLTGDKVKVLFGTYKGQQGIIRYWSVHSDLFNSDLFIVKVKNAAGVMIEIALRDDEMEMAK